MPDTGVGPAHVVDPGANEAQTSTGLVYLRRTNDRNDSPGQNAVRNNNCPKDFILSSDFATALTEWPKSLVDLMRRAGFGFVEVYPAWGGLGAEFGVPFADQYPGFERRRLHLKAAMAAIGPMSGPWPSG